jgi:hypothetical protein
MRFAPASPTTGASDPFGQTDRRNLGDPYGDAGVVTNNNGDREPEESSSNVLARDLPARSPVDAYAPSTAPAGCAVASQRLILEAGVIGHRRAEPFRWLEGICRFIRVGCREFVMGTAGLEPATSRV